MQEKLLSVINSVLSNSGLDKITQLNPNADLRNDLELDSISLAELVALIDNRFGVDINAEGMIETVGDIQNRLSR